MAVRLLMAALFLFGSILVSAEDAGAGFIIARALVESGQQGPTRSSTAFRHADFNADSDNGTYSFGLVVSGITLTDITFPDGNGLAFGAIGPVHMHNAPQGANGPIVAAFDSLVLYSETGDGFRLRAFGPLDSLLTGITSETFLNRLALRSGYVDVHSFPSFPSGEIRGQIVAIPEPDSLTFLCFGLAVLAVSRLVRRSSGKAFIFRSPGRYRIRLKPDDRSAARASV